MPTTPAAYAARLVCCWLSIIAVTAGCTRMPETEWLDCAQVRERLGDPEWILVDTRESDAFNGWALDGVQRGGHIPGAVDFPAGWLNVDVENRSDRLAGALQSKGITSEKKVVLYSIDERERRAVAEYLYGLGFRNLYRFDLQEWVDEDGELVSFPGFQQIIPASVAKRLMDGELPPTFENAKQIKFVEASWGDESESYSQGHVPGSFHVNTDHFEPPPQWYLGDSRVLTAFAENYGFQSDDTIIICSEDSIASYRLYIVLRYMGVDDVRVVNGGLAAWKQAGYEIETESHAAPEPRPFGANIPQYPEWVVDSERVRTELKRPENFSLIDVRTWAEYLGEKSGYSYHEHKGRIPGSLYGQGEFRGSDSMTPYRNIDGTMRNVDEILEMWEESGIDTGRHLSFMCGGGWRAAEVLVYARVAGKVESSLYSDGWIGWSNDRSNPIESGPPNGNSQ